MKGVEPRALDYTSQQAKVVVVIIVIIVVGVVVLPPLGQATGLHFRQIHLQIQSWMFSTMIERLNPGLQLAANSDKDKVKHKYKDKAKYKDKERTKTEILQSFEA